MGEITQLLRDAGTGDAAASRELFARICADLKRLARGSLRRNGGRDELDTTMLVHEAYVKLAAHDGLVPADRPAFFACVGKVMRSVVLDTVRERHAGKRGGGVVPLALTTGIAGEAIDDARLVEIDEALRELAPDLHALVEMRDFAGLSVQQASEALGRSVRSVERDGAKARAIPRRLVEDA